MRFGKVKSGFILPQDIILLFLSLWYILSWRMNGCCEVGLFIIRTFIPYAIVYAGLRLVACADIVYTEIALVIVSCVVCIVESCYGLGQIFGFWPSNNAVFAMTGHFSNPGPFGGFVATLTAIAISYLSICDKGPKYLRALAISAAIFGALVIPASLSRAAWAGLAIGVGVTLATVGKYRKMASGHPVACIVLVLIITAIAVGAIFLKTDSALGRAHIWHMDLRAMFQHPLFGAGPGFGLGVYGSTQENWFMANPEKMISWRTRVAGCPEYAFNELLGIGMEVGLPGFLMALAAVLLGVTRLLQRHSPFAAGLICSLVFSCASYPLSFPLFASMITVLLAFAGATESRLSFRSSTALPAIIGVTLIIGGGITIYSSRNVKSRPDLHDIFEEGHMLFTAGRYEDSIDVLTEGRRMSSDVMFGIIIGRCHEALGHMDEAEKEYRAAHYRVPCRLYPLVRLMRLQVRMGENKEAMETARSILDMPVNSRHAAMKRLHDETESCLDSLMSLTDNTINCSRK